MKTNIKMKCDDNQFRKAMDILKLDYNHRLHYEDMYIIINSHLSAEWGYGGTIYNDSRSEEIDADLFIRTNGTCEEDTNYKSGDFLKCIVFYDIGVRVGSTYQIQEVDNYNSRISFLDDDLDTRSIEISRLNKYFKKVENKYTELSTSIDKPYNVPILESKLKKKNEILKKARIKRKNQREELNKLNIKLQKCISLEEHNLATQKLRDTIVSLRDEVISKIDNMRDTKDREIEKLKAVIEYLESKVK